MTFQKYKIHFNLNADKLFNNSHNKFIKKKMVINMSVFIDSIKWKWKCECDNLIDVFNWF